MTSFLITGHGLVAVMPNPTDTGSKRASRPVISADALNNAGFSFLLNHGSFKKISRSLAVLFHHFYIAPLPTNARMYAYVPTMQ